MPFQLEVTDPSQVVIQKISKNGCSCHAIVDRADSSLTVIQSQDDHVTMVRSFDSGVRHVEPDHGDGSLTYIFGSGRLKIIPAFSYVDP